MLTLEHINKIYATPSIRKRRVTRPNEHSDEYIEHVLSVWDKTKSQSTTKRLTGVSYSTLRNFRVRRGDL